MAYDRVRVAVASDFGSGLVGLARTVASQIQPELVEEIRDRGDEIARSSVQVQLTTLHSATGVVAALIDTTRITLVADLDHEGTEHLRSAVDSLARATLTRALAGDSIASAVYRRGESPRRAGLAPVRTLDGAVAGVVAVEAEATYLPVLSALGRTLAVVAFLSALAITVLAALIIRATWSAARLERRLSRAENLAAMGRLTATLAHEIKNPLAIIRGSAERLEKLEPEAQRMADFVIEETDRLSRTVGRYLQFARGGDEVQETGDALATLDATLDLLEGELKARRVFLERPNAAPGRAPVALDNESLKQVYLNLILNALDAMPEGGRLRIEEAERHGKIEVSIADEGLGIPPGVLKRMGSPFYTTKAKGSGLGLFLTRRLVQASGGDLLIQSQAGRGTTCTVRLPRKKG